MKIKKQKCFGMCGCDTNNLCTNCNSSYFIGYDNPQSISSGLFSSTAPDTDGTICSTNFQYIDVRFIIVFDFFKFI